MFRAATQESEKPSVFGQSMLHMRPLSGAVADPKFIVTHYIRDGS
jgi:hypothetical protein